MYVPVDSNQSMDLLTGLKWNRGINDGPPDVKSSKSNNNIMTHVTS